MSFPVATTGALKPSPMSFFQRSFGLRNVTSERAVGDVPLRSGPRNCGQSAANAAADKAAVKTHASAR